MLSYFVVISKITYIFKLKITFIIFLITKKYILLTYFSMILFIQEINFSPEICTSWLILIIKINEKKKVLKRNPLCLNRVIILLQKTDT